MKGIGLRCKEGRRGVTLLEILTVVAIVAVAGALIVPAFRSICEAQALNSAVNKLVGTLEQAAGFARSRNTYAWVGILEEDASQIASASSLPGIGRLVLATVASQDGRRYRDAAITATEPAPFGTGSGQNGIPIAPVGKLVKIEGLHLWTRLGGGGFNPTGTEAVPEPYQVGSPLFAFHDGIPSGSVRNPTTFRFPGHENHRFEKILEFSPSGEVGKIVDCAVHGPQPWIEIALVPARMRAAESGPGVKNPAVVIRIEGSTGRIEVLRP